MKIKKNGKIIILSESDLEKIVNKTNIDEGIFGDLSDVRQGLKGAWRGEGYDYFKYVNTIKRIAQDLKRLDKPNRKIMTNLDDLKNKISTSKMPQDKRDRLVKVIDMAINHFNQYSNLIDQIEIAAQARIN